MAHPFENEILKRLEAGESLRSICRTEGYPTEGAVRQWALKEDDFSTQYARARDLGLDAIADEVMAIADDGSADMVTRFNEKGSEYQAVDQEHINRSRLRFDARRWYLSKLAPKRYGDRIENRLAGPEGEALKIVVTGIRPTEENSK